MNKEEKETKRQLNRFIMKLANLNQENKQLKAEVLTLTIKIKTSS